MRGRPAGSAGVQLEPSCWVSMLFKHTAYALTWIAPDAYHHVTAPKLGCGASANTEEAKAITRGSERGPFLAASQLGSHHAFSGGAL